MWVLFSLSDNQYVTKQLTTVVMDLPAWFCDAKSVTVTVAHMVNGHTYTFSYTWTHTKSRVKPIELHCSDCHSGRNTAWDWGAVLWFWRNPGNLPLGFYLRITGKKLSLYLYYLHYSVRLWPWLKKYKEKLMLSLFFWNQTWICA